MRIKRGPANSQNPARRNEVCGPRPARPEFVEDLTASIATDRPAGTRAQLLSDAVRGLEVSLHDIPQNLLLQRKLRP
jgi:hypothetical protein